MKNVVRLIVLALIALALVGCKSAASKVVLNTGKETPVVVESPVSGKPLTEAKKQIELDERMLALCPIPLPAIKITKGKALDALSIKKAETAIYYDCANRHNDLVKFLAEKLGILPGPKEPAETNATPSSVR